MNQMIVGLHQESVETDLRNGNYHPTENQMIVGLHQESVDTDLRNGNYHPTENQMIVGLHQESVDIDPQMEVNQENHYRVCHTANHKVAMAMVMDNMEIHIGMEKDNK